MNGHSVTEPVDQVQAVYNAHDSVKSDEVLLAQARAEILHGLKMTALVKRRQDAADILDHGRVEPLTSWDVQHLEERRAVAMATVDRDVMLDAANEAIGTVANRYWDRKLVCEIGRAVIAEYETRLTEAR